MVTTRKSANQPGTAAVKSPVKPAVKAAARAASKSARTNQAKAAKKAVAKPTAKTVTKPAAKPAVHATVPAPAAPKPAKVKLVRDGFTIPAAEYAVLGELKQRALAAAHPAKKSELLRAGIKLLAALSDEAFLAALAAVPAVKTGRPGKK